MSARLAEALAACEDARRQRQSSALALFGPPADVDAATRAIDSVTRHAPTEWRKAALDAVRLTAERLDVLTVDDVRPSLPDDVPVYDERAVGGVMRRAARLGWIVSTQSYRPSTRPEAHGRPLLLWRSRIHRGTP